jgi:NitT/TauT family transport system permease protein
MRALAAAVGNIFVPNRVISPRAMQITIAAQLLLTLAFWWSSPLAVLPRPDEVANALSDLWLRQGLGRELIASFVLNVEALALTAALSLALSYLTVIPVFRPVAAAISKGRFLGLIGLTFVFTLTFGSGRPLKLSLLVFGMTVFFVTSMAAVVAEIPKEKFDHARTLGMPEWRVVWEVVVLGTADKAMEVFRQNAAIGWMMLTMVEGISRSDGGLGAVLLNQNKHFRLAEIFAIQLLILTVGIVQDIGIGGLRRFLFPYADLHLERR